MYNLAGVFHLCLFISLTGYGSIKTKLLRVRSTLNISVIAQRCFLKCLDLNFSDKGDVCGGIRTIGSDIQQPIHFFLTWLKSIWHFIHSELVQQFHPVSAFLRCSSSLSGSEIFCQRWMWAAHIHPYSHLLSVQRMSRLFGRRDSLNLSQSSTISYQANFCSRREISTL